MSRTGWGISPLPVLCFGSMWAQSLSSLLVAAAHFLLPGPVVETKLFNSWLLAGEFVLENNIAQDAEGRLPGLNGDNAIRASGEGKLEISGLAWSNRDILKLSLCAGVEAKISYQWLAYAAIVIKTYGDSIKAQVGSGAMPRIGNLHYDSCPVGHELYGAAVNVDPRFLTHFKRFSADCESPFSLLYLSFDGDELMVGNDGINNRRHHNDALDRNFSRDAPLFASIILVLACLVGRRGLILIVSRHWVLGTLSLGCMAGLAHFALYLILDLPR